jgi:hypothetical protein
MSDPFAGLREIDNKVELAVQRAVNQISFALRDFGLYVTVDPDGNFGVDRLPAEVPIKAERVCDYIRRQIADGHRRNRPLTAIQLPHVKAALLALELADMQLDHRLSEATILANLVSGKSRFMDLPVTVTL